MQEIFENYFKFKEKTPVGWAGFVLDVLICLAVIVAFIVFLTKHFKKKLVIPVLATYLVLTIVSIILKLVFIPIILITVLFMFLIMIIVYFIPELKATIIMKNKAVSSRRLVSSQEVKENLIDEIVEAVASLSKRSIGAIITIEKEDALDKYSKVKIDGAVSAELLMTIFHPNTPLHDGAVVIRGSHILFAGGFYPSSDNRDIPQHYGSRHRAAVGISEVTDSFTIVVSEETGKLATTQRGTLESDVSLERIRNSLEQHILVK